MLIKLFDETLLEAQDGHDALGFGDI